MMFKVKLKDFVWFVAIVTSGIWFVFYYSRYNSGLKCPIDGPFSSAPMNLDQFSAGVQESVLFLKSMNIDTIVYTTVNEEATKYNLTPFLNSIKSATPSFHNSLILFCLDKPALQTCQSVHHPKLCIFMDMGISGDSLAPGGNDRSNIDYWRLTYGRVYATMALHKHNINVLAVDVDAVFLQNPFNALNGIVDSPNGIKVVQDIEPFTFRYGSKVPINGGFLYFPGVDPIARQYSKELIDKVWEKNCQPQKNEQLVTSSVLRFMARKYKSDPLYDAKMLSAEQYLNFCSTDCGTGKEFSSILSIADLNVLDTKWSGSREYSCDVNARKKWVYFHAACLNKEKQSKDNVAKAKGMIQSAIYEWVKAE